jgi:hypothetical protein
MSDDTARRDVWRDAQAATTVTGRRTQPLPGRFESRSEALELLDEVAPDPEHVASQVTHPPNAAPEATAITNADGSEQEAA